MIEENLKDFIRLKRPEQGKIKPQIEDIINANLDGDMKKTALDFAAYIRDNYMPLKWSGLNTWENDFCHIVMFIETAAKWGNSYPPNWLIILSIDIDKYESLIAEEGLQQIIWDNVFYCVHKNNEGKKDLGCSPIKGCAGGVTKTFLGKEFRGVCKGRTWSVFNPGEATLNGIKKLLELDKKARGK